MRDTTHDDFIIRWANYVKNNQDKWQSSHTALVNSQIKHSQEFMKRLSKQSGGIKKIIKLYSIKNLKGYKKLLF